MKTKIIYLLNIIIIILSYTSCTNENVWIETTQEDFAYGKFDGGGNLYASPKGDIQVVNSWDLNQDGWLDIFFSNYSNDTSYNIFSDIYWGSEKGFNLKNKTSLLTHASIAHAVADLNNDGFMDIIYGSWQNKEHDMNEYSIEKRNRFFGSYSLIYWGENNGFNTTNYSEIFTYAPTGISVADINNDGYLDIIFGSSKEGETVIFWGMQSGFDRKNITKLNGYRGMVNYPVDLNNDSFLDIINTNLEVDSFSKIYYSSKKGFSENNISKLKTSMVRSVAVADLNNDNYLDLIFANGKIKDTYKTDSYIYWGNDKGYSVRRKTLLPTILAMQPAVADMNNDGHLDIVFANCFDGIKYNVNSYIYYGSEHGFSVEDRAEIPTCGAHSIAIADYDENGEMNLVFSSTGDPEGKTVNYFSSLIYQKNGNFVQADVKFPTQDGHHNTNRDLGNIYDRKYRDTYISSILDAHYKVKWRKVDWEADIPEGCAIKVFLRGVNNQHNHQDWIEIEKGQYLENDLISRYCQYKVEFHYDGKGRPKLSEIKINYRNDQEL